MLLNIEKMPYKHTHPCMSMYVSDSFAKQLEREKLETP